MKTKLTTPFPLKSLAWLLICTISTSAFAQSQAAAQSGAAAPANEAKDSRNLAAPLNGYAEHLRPQRGTPGKPYAPIKPVDDKALIPEVDMFVGETRVFPSPNIGRIAVGNGQIMSAAAIDDKEVIVFANAPGTSSLFIWNKDGRYQRIKINIVGGDTSRIAREVAAFLSGIPNSKASIVGDKVIVEGEQLADADLLKIEQLEKRYPQIINFTNRIGWEQMVMMDVKVVEFPTSELRDIGLKWNSTGGVAVGGVWAPVRRGADGPYQVNLQTDSPAPITNPAGGAIFVPSKFNVLSMLNMGLNAQLNLLEQEGKAAILAEPQLSARNGAKASFLAGGEFPYSVASVTGVTIQFKPYGIKLDIAPRVDRNGVIRATIDAEVSSIDSSVQTAAGPALLTRKTNTEFNVKSGETIVLSGLLQRNSNTDIDKLPLLGDIPILGALFRSKRYQNKETELVVFVTPTVVDSRSPGLTDRVQKTTERLQQSFGPKPYLSAPLQPERDMGRPDLPQLPAQSGQGPDGNVQPTLVNDKNQGQPVAQLPLSAPMPLLRSKIDGLNVRQDPSNSSPVLMRMGQGGMAEALPAAANGATADKRWIAVKIGAIRGWANREFLEPAILSSQVQPGRSEIARADQALEGAATDIGPQSSITANKVDGVHLPRYRVNLDQLVLRMAPDVNGSAVTRLGKGQLVEALPQPPRGYWTAVKAGDKTGWVSTQWIERE